MNRKVVDRPIKINFSNHISPKNQFYLMNVTLQFLHELCDLINVYQFFQELL